MINNRFNVVYHLLVSVLILKFIIMKIYNINFDTVSITVVLEDNQNLFDFLLQSKDWNCKDLYVVGDKLYKKWSDDYSDECIITDLTDVRGIIHSESH